jgi:hypothetical protein
MKNKLLLSSALLGSLVIGSAAYSQTTITGNLSLSYKSISEHGLTDAIGTHTSARAFGRESQINIQNRGKLNNGMDYAAGFSFENDGSQQTDISDENVYIDFISGNTTFTIGVDHIQNTNRTLGNFVGNDASDLATGNPYLLTAEAAPAALAGAQSLGFIQSAGSNPAQAMGVGVTQRTPVGTLSALYVPTVRNSGSDNEVGNLAGANAVNLETNRESAYEIGFAGDLGVKGLSTHIFYNVEEEVEGFDGKLKGTNIGASYNFGQITVGYNRKENKLPFDGGDKLKQDEFGIAYAATPNLTLAANYTRSKTDLGVADIDIDLDDFRVTDAKSKSVAVGYNFGPVAVIGQLARQEDIVNVAGTDQDVAFIKINTNF